MSESTTELSVDPSIIPASQDILDGPTSVPPSNENLTQIDALVISKDAVPNISAESSSPASDTVAQNDSSAATLPTNSCSPHEIVSEPEAAPVPEPPAPTTESRPLPFSVLPADLIPFASIFFVPSTAPASASAPTPDSLQSQPATLPAELPNDAESSQPSPLATASALRRPSRDLSGPPEKRHVHFTQLVNDEGTFNEPVTRTEDSTTVIGGEKTPARDSPAGDAPNGEAPTGEAAVTRDAPDVPTNDVLDAMDTTEGSKSVPTPTAAVDVEALLDDNDGEGERGAGKSTGVNNSEGERGAGEGAGRSTGVSDGEGERGAEGAGVCAGEGVAGGGDGDEDEDDCVLEQVTYADAKQEEEGGREAEMGGGAEPVPVRKASEARGSAFTDDVCVIEDDDEGDDDEADGMRIKRSRLTPHTPLGDSAAFTSFEHAQHTAANLKELAKNLVRRTARVLLTYVVYARTVYCWLSLLGRLSILSLHSYIL